MQKDKKILLQQMQQMTLSFCAERVDAFLERIGSNQQKRPGQRVADSTLTPLSSSARADFCAAFMASMTYAFTDFHDLLAYGAELLELTETTHAAVKGDLAMPAMLDQAEQRFAKPLTDLNQRLAVISDCDIGLASNPLAPVQLALALEHAAQSLPWNLQARVEAIKVFDAEVLQYLGHLYAEINRYLGDRGITAKPPDTAANGQPRHDVAAESSLRDKPIAAPQKVQNSIDPASFAAIAEDELAAFDEAVAGDNAGDRDEAQAFVNRLFSELVDQRSPGEELKELLADLYLPYARLAAVDSSFVDAQHHPAIHLLNGLGKACDLYRQAAVDAHRSALLLEMKAVVQRLSQAGEPGRDSFADAAFRFSAALRQHEREIAGRSGNRQRQQSGLRYLEGWKRHVGHVIRSKLDQHPVPVPEAVRLFLVGPWKNYMASQYLNAATHNVQPTQQLALADEILAYVAPADGSAAVEFTAIAAPVRQCMVACSVDEKEIRQFLLQLIYFHRLARSVDEKPKVASAPA